jgi:hypothetical protein
MINSFFIYLFIFFFFQLRLGSESKFGPSNAGNTFLNSQTAVILFLNSLQLLELVHDDDEMVVIQARIDDYE